MIIPRPPKKHATTTAKSAISRSAAARQKLHEMTADAPAVEWKPYVVPKAMEEAIKRVDEIKRWPSRFV